MRLRTKINSIISFIAAGLLTIFRRSPAKPGPNDLNRMDFKTSTQRMGVRFREKIRDVFRLKWIKKINND